jgi:hypothetical protein
MPIRLGEMLIKAGMITHTQLDEALKGQVIFGGRLGTNLIEMGVIGEEELARVLSEKLRVPCVDPDELMAVPDHLLSLVPRDMVERYKIVPLGVDGRRLRLVMADPSDLPAIDEIAFRTGFVIVPMVAPEIRLFMALEKYYGIRREVRALPVSETLGGRRCTYGTKRPAEQLMRRDVVDFSTLPDNGKYLPWEGGDIDDNRIEAAERYTIDALSRTLADCRERDAVADALVDYAGRLFGCAGLLLVMRDMAAGWEAVAGHERLREFGQLRISLQGASHVRTVVEERSVYLGPPGNMPTDRRLAEALGGAGAPGLMLVPMVMGRRVVTILCAAGEMVALGARLSEAQTIARKGVLAFEILILRGKILMT